MDEADRAGAWTEVWLDAAIRRQAGRGRADAASLPGAPLGCETCGEPIPQARRDAAPAAKRCVACQELAEMRSRC